MAHQLSSTTQKVLKVLNDCAVHTGSDVATALGISRTAVWKIIQRLKNYNIQIQSQHQGYQLMVPLVLIDKKHLERSLKGQGISLEIFESISSTRDHLRDKTPTKKINICLSEYQSHGRGRLGRVWASPFGRNIYCSLRYTFNKDMSELSGLSLVVGILTANALESLNSKLKFSLKWPNDIYINDKKMGGILIDLSAEAHGNCTVIISLGLNINMKDIPLDNVDQPWTSLEHVLNEKLDRNAIVIQIIQSILGGMEIFQQKGIEPFLQEWNRFDLLKNKTVSISTGTQIISGIAKGINPQGNLRLELPSGLIETFSYGDTIF